MTQTRSIYWLFYMGMLTCALPTYASPWFVEGSVGASKFSVDQDQVLQYSEKPYFFQGDSHSSGRSKGIYSLGVGYHWNRSEWDYEMALHYEQWDAQTFSGTVAPIEPQFVLLNYHYDISGKSLMLSGKALLHTNSRWSPYFMGGVGYARNRFSDYSVTHVQDTQSYTDPEPFGSHDTNNIAWRAGFGFRYHWTRQLGLDFGYQYSGMGDADSSTGGRSGQKIELNNLAASEFSLGIHYQF